MAEFKEIQVDGQVYQVKDETARGNQGGYKPPVGGIPKTDLASDVETSLGKADTALQAADKTQLQSAIDSLRNALNTITQDGATQGVIDTFNEVKAFLDGIDTDDPTLANQLLALNNAINAVQTSLAGKANSADVNSQLALKQNVLTFDDEPGNTDNPVKSRGIKAALIAKANAVDVPTKTEMADAIDDAVGNAQVAVVPVGSVGVIAGLNSDSDSDALAASMGKRLNLRLAEIEGGKIDTEEDGFFVIDENGNIGMQYDEDGLDVALLSQHFIALLNQAGIGSSYKSQCVVRFLPFLSAWNNASKNSLCLCSTKQQLVDNKVPFYDGFLFHKLPTDDKSLWYGTTLENAVQIGTVNFTPKNCLLAMSPTDGRVIATVRGDRGDIHVWDGTTDHTVAAVTSDGNNRKAMGWLYNSGVDFIKDGNNVERCIFAEYDGSLVDKGGFYVWVGTYPYTNANNWKTTLHKPLQYYGTIQDGTITHFHQVRRDPWTNILYLTSGDQPGQLVWWYSTDYGDTWTELTNNKTNGWEEHVCRLINFCFTDEWIYWATDHGTNHCLNRIKRNAQTGVIDPSTREKLCDLPFAQACNSICLCESPNGIFMYERIDTGTEYEQYYGSKVKMLFWSIQEERLYTVAELGLTNNSWGGSRGKCYLNYTNGQQPRPAMGFSDDTRCYFDIVGADNSNIGTIFYEL